ncbi:hypothetical protein B0T19DRAFT_438482 [Cercophora scortea]|uniref:Uncharacterized protein n=1 Tax=Cercophora scortea TaxID=314031 RepID=A0AAE0MHV5_9PEZI|nr:hypothetical protein B0T19DRAFT_438482 [Cercophora scortea]
MSEPARKRKRLPDSRPPLRPPPRPAGTSQIAEPTSSAQSISRLAGTSQLAEPSSSSAHSVSRTEAPRGGELVGNERVETDSPAEDPLRNFPPVTKGLLKTLLAPAIDENWTEEEEEALEAEWKVEPVSVKIMGLQPNVLCPVAFLFRVTIRMYGCLPTDIINIKRRLANDTSHRLEKEFKNSDTPAWSHNFCPKLQKVLIQMHPMCRSGQGRVTLVVMAIQLAVIVRTDDRRTWRLENPTQDPFIAALIDAINEQENVPPASRPTMVDMLQSVKDRLNIADPGSPLSLLARLFMAVADLNKKTSKTKTRVLEESFRDRPYVVTGKDLVKIGEALDSLTDLPNPMIINEKEGAPRGYRAVRDTLYKAGLKMRREAKMEEKKRLASGGA